MSHSSLECFSSMGFINRKHLIHSIIISVLQRSPAQWTVNLACLSFRPILLRIHLKTGTIGVGTPYSPDPSFEAFLVKEMTTLCPNDRRRSILEIFGRNFSSICWRIVGSQWFDVEFAHADAAFFGFALSPGAFAWISVVGHCKQFHLLRLYSIRSFVASVLVVATIWFRLLLLGDDFYNFQVV